MTYYSGAQSVIEYVLLLHGGYPEQKALSLISTLERRCGVTIDNPYDLDEVVEILNGARPPSMISVEKDGRYDRVTGRLWK